MLLPGAFTPTGSEVEISAVLVSQTEGPSFFCGALTGEIVSFGMDLDESTFGAVPWEDRTDDSPTSCDGAASTISPTARTSTSVQTR